MQYDHMQVFHPSLETCFHFAIIAKLLYFSPTIEIYTKNINSHNHPEDSTRTNYRRQIGVTAAALDHLCALPALSRAGYVLRERGASRAEKQQQQQQLQQLVGGGCDTRSIFTTALELLRPRPCKYKHLWRDKWLNGFNI